MRHVNMIAIPNTCDALFVVLPPPGRHYSRSHELVDKLSPVPRRATRYNMAGVP